MTNSPHSERETGGLCEPVAWRWQDCGIEFVVKAGQAHPTYAEALYDATTIRAQAAELERLKRLLTQRDRLAANSTKFWVRAGKAALAGNASELLTRIQMAEAPPVAVVLSNTSEQST